MKNIFYKSSLAASRAVAVFAFLYFLLFAYGGVAKNVLGLSCSLGAFCITFLPFYLCQKSALRLPQGWYAGFAVFVVSSMVLGTALNFYLRFWWWDIYLHLTSGLVLCIFGFYLHSALNGGAGGKTFAGMLFAFCFAVAFGTIWEFYEFGCDMLLGTDMQCGITTAELATQISIYTNRFGNYVDPAVADTMKDLAMNTLGALAALVLKKQYNDK